MTGLLAISSWAVALTVPAVVMAIVCSMAANELTSYGTKLGLRVVRLAARLLPPPDRDRFIEEWSADVLAKSDHGKHELTALAWALGTLVAAVRRSRASARFQQWAWTDGTEPAITFLWLDLLLVLAVLSVRPGQVVVLLGVVFGLAAGMVIVLTDRLGHETPCGLDLGLTFGIAIGLAGGMLAGVGAQVIVGLAAHLLVGTAFGITLGLAAGVMFARTSGFACGMVAGLFLPLAIAPAFGFAFGATAVMTAGLAAFNAQRVLVSVSSGLRLVIRAPAG